MQVQVLGTLQVLRDGRLLSPGGPKERKLLAVLALHLGEVVSVDAIADALWDGTPPRSAVKSVQVYVTRLRAALDPARSDAGVIHTSPPGYRLVLGRADLDANVFTDLVRRARQENDGGQPEQAERLLDEAFALWRGEPYGEFADVGYFAAEVRRLMETRLAGLEVRLSAGLALGRHAEAVAEAQVLCADHPLHEGFWVQLVTALYRSGRQADALTALRAVRDLLADELGADPGAKLRTLEQRVLRQDPTLAAATHLPGGVPPLPSELNRAGRLFVGRAAELAWLRQAWSDVAARGEARLLVIAGPAGSGRTSLVGEFASELHAARVAVHYRRLGVGLSVLDDLDDTTVSYLRAVTGRRPMLCVATYDPGSASAAVRRGLLAASPDERVLTPLDRAEAAQLVVGMAGPIEADMIEEITGAAECWPAVVERVTAQLVSDRSTQRVAAAVDLARPASRSLATARGEIAAGVRDLARVRAWHAEGAPGPGRFACPYKGLATYEQQDAPLFHGREDLVERLCARLVDAAFVAVVGASGAGKSSLVRAGLLPALTDGMLPGLAGAPHHLLAPGAPLPVVDGPAVIVVDQFEEIFTRVTDDAARGRYLDELTALASRPGIRIVVVLRGDFVGACASHPRLAELVGDSTVLVGPMRADDIRRVVERPARLVGLSAEPALLDAIVSDMESSPAALPLLSTMLVEVWQRRSGATLTAEAYHRAGGVSGAVARLGESAYTNLDEPTKDTARRLLMRLADTGEGGTIVRRRVPRAELGDDPATARAIGVLVARRLLSAGEQGVELTHEALLTHWPRLAGWLADDEQGRSLRRHLAPAALAWHDAGRPDTELYRGARLASALDWAGERLAELTGVERDFLTASRDYSDRTLQEEIARANRQARGRRRLRAALAAAIGLLLVASGTAWLAVDRQRAAAEASRQALARRLGALALVTPDLDRSLLLAVQAMRTHDDWETRGDLLAVLSRSAQALRQVRGVTDQGTIQNVALTPDGSTVVAGGHGRLFTWRTDTLAATGEPVGASQRTEAIIAGLNPGEVFVVTAIDVDRGKQAVIRWDARTRSSVRSYPLPKGIFGSTRRLALTTDGRTLAVPTRGRSLLLYDVATTTPPAQVQLDGPADDVWPIRELLVTAVRDKGIAQFVDPVAKRLVRKLPLPFPGSVVPSPDGRLLLVLAPDRAALIAADDPAPIRYFSGATLAAATAAFSGDGKLVAIGGDDQVIGVWDVATGDLRDTLRGHAAPVRGLAFAADGRTLYSAAQDNSVIAWDVAGDRSFAVRHRPLSDPALPAGADSGLTTINTPLVAWSRDGSRVYVAAADSSAAAVIDVASGRITSRPPPVARDPAEAAPVADLDRQAIFTSTTTGLLRRHDLQTGATRASPVEPPLESHIIALSGDGRVLADELESLDEDGNYQVRGVDLLSPDTMADRRRMPPLGFVPWHIWLSQDGSLLAATEHLGNHVELWDTRTGRPRWQTDIGYQNGSAIAISPDGNTMAVGTLDGAVVLLDVASGRVLARRTERLSSHIASVQFSPDGEVIALGGSDGRAHLLDPGTLREIGQLPLLTGGSWAFVFYHPDGSHLFAVDERGHVVRWDTRPESWVARACEIVGRDFTPAEWDSYLPGVPLQRTCTTG